MKKKRKKEWLGEERLCLVLNEANQRINGVAVYFYGWKYIPSSEAKTKNYLTSWPSGCAVGELHLSTALYFSINVQRTKGDIDKGEWGKNNAVTFGIQLYKTPKKN